MLKKFSGLMENTTAYRLWQAPFADAKIGPLLRHNDFSRIRRVLDVGCGPGTNCLYFKTCDYTGFDINPSYIEYATRRFGRHFVVQDVCTFEANPSERFDFVLLNSLLHHLTDDETNRILGRIGPLLTPDGHVHIIDLVMPLKRGIPRWLAANDRGDYPRLLSCWRDIFERHFESIVFEAYPISLLGFDLWNLVYFKGKPKE